MSEEIVAENTGKSKKVRSKLMNDAADLFESVLISIFLVMLIFTFLFKIATVDGPSMNNTLLDKDRLIVSHLMYEPQNGDVVIINDENGHVYADDKKTVIETEGLDKKIVKRIIAMSGQVVDIDFSKGIVYLDGQKLDEPYICEPTFNNAAAFDYPVTVPEGYVFVMGDNRNISRDSRDEKVGFVPVNQIMGKVVFRIYPFNSFGKIK